MKFSAFMRGAVQVFSILPAQRPRLVVKPPKIMTDEQAMARDWGVVVSKGSRDAKPRVRTARPSP